MNIYEVANMADITLAKTAGFCFGVERAVQIVYEQLETEKDVCTLGPIIHNDEVVNDMKSKGVRVITEEDIDDTLNGATVIIRSHGISKDIQTELEKTGCKIVDATCPFVKKIHNTVTKYSDEGYEIVIIGSKHHPEVQGIMGWCDNRGNVIENESDVRNFDLENPRKKVCIVAQTTFNQKKFQELVEIISKKGYDIIAVNTICNATAERQNEAFELAGKSDIMIVIGGKNSSNTRKLYEICKSQCENTHFIQTLKDLDMELLKSDLSLGITAGASTPKNIIQEVLTACQKKEVLENY